MIGKFRRFINTIKYLKAKQVIYRVFYIFRNRLSPLSYAPKIHDNDVNLLKFAGKKFILKAGKVSESTEMFNFCFLNISAEFPKESLFWNYSKFGKLWTYNLTYFEFLDSAEKELGLSLIHKYIDDIDKIKDGLEPYPSSLRIMSWIKFLSNHQIVDQKITQSLYGQLKLLSKHIEYHILGNHLLENAFALLFGAYYFNDDKILRQCKVLLNDQLTEQLLDDGGHYERSPMYHQIVLFRVLDCLNLVRSNPGIFPSKEFENYLMDAASAMLSWLTRITFSNNQIPLLNDATNDIAPKTDALSNYAKLLAVPTVNLPLGQSGYRTFENNFGEVIIDFGDVGPDYQPGHAHSDTFTFVMNYLDTPFIVDTGISTYNMGFRRNEERNTAAHNTTRYGNIEQTETWGGFRVARRAKCSILEEKKNTILGSHTGYGHLKIACPRELVVRDTTVEIFDGFSGSVKHKCFSYLHFDYRLTPELKNDMIHVGDVEIQLNGFGNTALKGYQQSMAYNTLENATMFEGEFLKNSSFVIRKREI
jgi:hypothetical protein